MAACSGATSPSKVFSSPASCVFLYSSVPNPPGPIEVLLVTTNSIDITWTKPHLMSGASFQYRLNISLPRADVANVTDVMAEGHTFDSLPSGTPFDISVQTVGTMMFVSEMARTQMVTTSEELSLAELQTYVLQLVLTVTISGFITKDRSVCGTSPRHQRRSQSLQPGPSPWSTRKLTASV